MIRSQAIIVGVAKVNLGFSIPPKGKLGGNTITSYLPIYLDPVNHKYFGAHFYAPSKYFLDYKLDTFSANLIVIWLMTLVLTITLYFDVLRKILEMKSSKR